MTDDIINNFIEEVRDLLRHLEDNLIVLETDRNNAALINNIFRLMHTMKGSSGMVGFKNIQDLTHEFESVYEQIRDGRLSVSTAIIDLTLKAKDLIMNILNGDYNQNDDKELIKTIREKFIQAPASNKSEVKEAFPEENIMQHQYVIWFRPDKMVFERGLDPEKTLNEIRLEGAVHIIAHEKGKTWQEQKKEKLCSTSWEIFVKSYREIGVIKEVFLFYDEDEFRVFEIDVENKSLEPGLAELIGSHYISGKPGRLHVKECLNLLPDLQNVLAAGTGGREVNSLPVVKKERQMKADSDSTISVSSHKLDELMNLVSELVTITATIEAHASGLNDHKLNNAIENVEKLTKRFRNNALDLRLVPVGSLLGKFKRQVRDLSHELGKNVSLLIEGQDIEIDKTILKSIENPLQHIIRNSIDHGLEKEEERLAKGKTPSGLLKITAFYSGASVIIQIQDDGKGINLERVKECALKKGYIQPDQAVTKQDLINLIMEPGFTTSENVSLVSGRGVGMDVVRKELNRVGGSLEIFTEADLGTSITIKLPMTLTIIDTLMVEVSDTQILIPVLDIEYCFKDEDHNLMDKDNRYISYKSNMVPVASLREQFKYPPSEQKDTMVIIINKFEKRYAITTDRIIGEHQAVIKPLGDLFANQPFFSGGSIMVDGKLALILDTNFLFNHVKHLT